MKNKLAHFAIHTDNIDRAKDFYGAVFAWEFASHGPSDFLQIRTGPADGGELIGALQSRNYSPLKEPILGLEGSIAVDNLDETLQRVQQKGGQILMPKTAIPYVGWIGKFLDTEGNLLCAVQYTPEAR